MTPMPDPLRARHRPPIVKRMAANDHRRHWAGHRHVGAFLVQLLALIMVNLALWGLFAWSAIRYARDTVPLSPLSGPL